MLAAREEQRGLHPAPSADLRPHRGDGVRLGGGVDPGVCVSENPSQPRLERTTPNYRPNLASRSLPWSAILGLGQVFSALRPRSRLICGTGAMNGSTQTGFRGTFSSHRYRPFVFIHCWAGRRTGAPCSDLLILLIVLCRFSGFEDGCTVSAESCAKKHHQDVSK